MTTTPTERPAGSIDPKLLEILVCPLTKSTLEYDAEKQELISRAAKLAYPIRDGIPIMLPEEARQAGLSVGRNRSDRHRPALVPGVHPSGSAQCTRSVDGRDKPGHDG